MSFDPFSVSVSPDWEAFVACLRRQGTPRRVHHIELFLDAEVQEALCRRFHLLDGLDADDPYGDLERQVRLQRFLGYDYVRVGLDRVEMPFYRNAAQDTADLARAAGRSFVNEHRGPVTTWEEFEAYPWPDPAKQTTRALEWYERHLPDDMCIVAGGGFAHFAEYLTWLMGYETLCYAVYDQPELVAAISQRLLEMYRVALARILTFERVQVVWGADDLGFRSGTFLSPDDTRRYFLPGHKLMADMAHARQLPYLLHACGNLAAIMEDLIADVGIDGKHSFEDTIETVVEAKRRYGQRIALLGGIDIDFMCRADEQTVRQRVRTTLDVCLPGGGYCLGSGNSIANYVPLNNYLAMLDEGRRYRI